ncbi:MAG TPA: tyrosinase family protein [Allosphingosinicella sp.]|jgi:tyrosinase
MTKVSGSGFSRRQLLAGGATLAGAAALPFAAASGQPVTRWHRYDVRSTEGKAMLRSYGKAVSAMLALPFTDPRNWYRVALSHFLDCPHGNWWILPWHRGFTGYVEQIVRQFSGDPNFAFPYWDWTDSPDIPAGMTGFLDPRSFVAWPDLNAFRAAVDPALAKASYWTDAGQLQQLTLRQMQTRDAMWTEMEGCYFPKQRARSPRRSRDCVTASAVSQPMIDVALAPQDFMTFGSPTAQHHSDHVGSGTLEGQPHNKIHNNVGGIVYKGTIGQCDRYSYQDLNGFMQANLSPVDPIFFLHHSNLDRLWEKWTRAQNAHNLPVVPPGPSQGQPVDYYAAWTSEPFLFFVDAAGNRSAKNRAGQFVAIDAFDYDYRTGSGVPGLEGVMAAPIVRARPPVRRFDGGDSDGLESTASAAAVRIVPDLIQASQSRDVQGVFAKITLSIPSPDNGREFPVFVHTGDPSKSVEAGSISVFGSHHHAGGLKTFVVPVGSAIAALARRKALPLGGLLYFRVLAPPPPAPRNGRRAAPRDLPIQSVVVEAH